MTSTDATRPETEAKVSTAPPAEASPARKRLSRRQKRLVAAAAVLVVAAFLIFWGAQPQEFVTPSQLAGSPSKYEGSVIQLRGVVTDLNTTAKTFLVGDDVVNVTVAYVVLPDGFQIGKEVIAKGKILTVSPLVFQAQDIIVGHAR